MSIKINAEKLAALIEEEIGDIDGANCLSTQILLAEFGDVQVQLNITADLCEQLDTVCPGIIEQ